MPQGKGEFYNTGAESLDPLDRLSVTLDEAIELKTQTAQNTKEVSKRLSDILAAVKDLQNGE